MNKISLGSIPVSLFLTTWSGQYFASIDTTGLCEEPALVIDQSLQATMAFMACIMAFVTMALMVICIVVISRRLDRPSMIKATRQPKPCKDGKKKDKKMRLRRASMRPFGRILLTPGLPSCPIILPQKVVPSLPLGEQGHEEAKESIATPSTPHPHPLAALLAARNSNPPTATVLGTHPITTNHGLAGTPAHPPLNKSQSDPTPTKPSFSRGALMHVKAGLRKFEPRAQEEEAAARKEREVEPNPLLEKLNARRRSINGGEEEKKEEEEDGDEWK